MAIYFTFYKKENVNKIIKIENRDYTILQRDIRDNDKGRRDGLSGTNIDYLCDGCAMLFSWPNDDSKERLIWMKDMNYNIDI